VDADKLKQFTLRLINEDQEIERRGGKIRSVCYGSDWKEVFETYVGDMPKVRDGTLSLRFEYIPSYPRMVEANGKIMTWARFRTFPDPADEDAPESVGILLPYSIFSRVEKDIEDFISPTTVRPLSHLDLGQIFKRISSEFQAP
jgi:hypothetical protein